jgi:hypothetical protein
VRFASNLAQSGFDSYYAFLRKAATGGSTTARKQPQLFAKTKDQPHMWLVFCFAVVHSLGLGKYTSKPSKGFRVSLTNLS